MQVFGPLGTILTLQRDFQASSNAVATPISDGGTTLITTPDLAVQANDVLIVQLQFYFDVGIGGTNLELRVQSALAPNNITFSPNYNPIIWKRNIPQSPDTQALCFTALPLVAVTNAVGRLSLFAIADDDAIVTSTLCTLSVRILRGK